MGQNSKIEWTEATWNPIRARNIETGGIGHYCEKVSPGCANCYAERMQPRFKNPIRYNAADKKLVEIYLDEDVLTQPLRWKRPRMIFPCSMTDLYGSWVPDEWLDKIFAVMALSHFHIFQVLTKRPERAGRYLASGKRVNAIWDQMGYNNKFTLQGKNPNYKKQCFPWLKNLKGSPSNPPWPLANLWLGVSIEDQKTVDERIPLLLQIPAVVRWLSIEPLLSSIDLILVPWVNPNPPPGPSSGPQKANALTGMVRNFSSLRHGALDPHWSDSLTQRTNKIDWVVVGGESGPNARPMEVEWVQNIKDQCRSAGVPFFMKQGAKANWPDYKDFDSFPKDLQIREFPNV